MRPAVRDLPIRAGHDLQAAEKDGVLLGEGVEIKLVFQLKPNGIVGN